jgi:hypothetical protein
MNEPVLFSRYERNFPRRVEPTEGDFPLHLLTDLYENLSIHATLLLFSQPINTKLASEQITREVVNKAVANAWAAHDEIAP